MVPGFQYSLGYNPARDCYARVVTGPDWLTLFAIHNIMRKNQTAEAPDAVLTQAISDYQKRSETLNPVDFPLGVAQTIDILLRAKKFDVEWAVYCAVTITKSHLIGCTSGDILVCAFSPGHDDQPLRRSRLHILAEEDSDWVERTYHDINLQEHGGVLIRSLGQGKGALPPENFFWEARPPFTLFICSSDCHRNEADGERLKNQLSEQLSANRQTDYDLFISVTVPA